MLCSQAVSAIAGEQQHRLRLEMVNASAHGSSPGSCQNRLMGCDYLLSIFPTENSP